MIYATTNSFALDYSVSIARVMGFCLLVVALFTTCRKEAPVTPKSVDRSTIETVDPLFLISGFTDKIDSDYGLPLQGLVANSVSYNLGITFPATKFFEDLESHLQVLGWFVPEFTFDYPPEPASEATIWRTLPTWNVPIRTRQQWWVRADEVLWVFAEHYLGTVGNFPIGQVRVTICRYHKNEAKRHLNQYRVWNGDFPSPQADVPRLLKNNSPITTEEP